MVPLPLWIPVLVGGIVVVVVAGIDFGIPISSSAVAGMVGDPEREFDIAIRGGLAFFPCTVPLTSFGLGDGG